MVWLAAHAPRTFPVRQWRRIFYTNESRITIFRPDGRRPIYRCRGERHAGAWVTEVDRFGGGSVMVWGGISHGVKSPLVVLGWNMTAVMYRDEILRPVAIPLVQQRYLIFQQDNGES